MPEAGVFRTAPESFEERGQSFFRRLFDEITLTPFFTLRVRTPWPVQRGQSNFCQEAGEKNSDPAELLTPLNYSYPDALSRAHFFSRYPVLNTHHTAARHSAMNASVMPTLMPTATSDTP